MAPSATVEARTSAPLTRGLPAARADVVSGERCQAECTMLVRSVWLNGTVGVGKTTVGEVLAQHLADAGDTVAFINTDDLGRCWPRPDHDRFNTALVQRNLASLASNYVDAGARTIVIAGVIQTNAQLERYSAALGTTPHLVRIVAPLEKIEQRLRTRHGQSDEPGLRWHLERAPELNTILDQSDLSMKTVDNSETPLATAKTVLAAIGWPNDAGPSD
jgi:adenylylsulfate kinase